jgi:hypothetical protein
MDFEQDRGCIEMSTVATTPASQHTGYDFAKTARTIGIAAAVPGTIVALSTASSHFLHKGGWMKRSLPLTAAPRTAGLVALAIASAITVKDISWPNNREARYYAGLGAGVAGGIGLTAAATTLIYPGASRYPRYLAAGALMGGAVAAAGGAGIALIAKSGG